MRSGLFFLLSGAIYNIRYSASILNRMSTPPPIHLSGMSIAPSLSGMCATPRRSPSCCDIHSQHRHPPQDAQRASR